MNEKNNKNQLLNMLDLFQDVSSLEKSEVLNVRDLEDTISRIRNIDGIISEESYKELTTVFIPSLSSPFGKDIALQQCKTTLKNINIGLLTSIRKTIEDMKFKVKEIKNKNIILDQMYEKMNQYKTQINNIKVSLTSFENKSKFLNACQSAAATNYRGLLYFGHSTISLAKVLNKVLATVFDKNGPSKGKEFIDNTNIKERLGLINYYLDREVLSKTTIEKIQDFFHKELENANNALNELNSFQKLPGYSLDEKVAFLMNAYDTNKEEFSAPNDDAQANAVIWSELSSNAVLAMEIGINFFNELKPRLGAIGGNEYQDLIKILEKIEESYKVNNYDEVDKFIELFKFGTIGEIATFYMDLYDVLSFITSTEYLLFVFILIYIMFETYRQEHISGE